MKFILQIKSLFGIGSIVEYCITLHLCILEYSEYFLSVIWAIFTMLSSKRSNSNTQERVDWPVSSSAYLLVGNNLYMQPFLWHLIWVVNKGSSGRLNAIIFFCLMSFELYFWFKNNDLTVYLSLSLFLICN